MTKDFRMLAAKFAKKARLYMANADKMAVEIGGESKAGELVWGAAALTVKAVAAMHGRKVTKYQHMFHFVKQISGDDKSIIVAFAAANSMHGKFYEGEPGLEEFLTVKDIVGSWMDDLFTRFDVPEER